MAKNSGVDGLEQFDQLMKELKGMGKRLNSQTTEKALRAGAKILKEEVINHPNIPVSDEAGKHARDDIRIRKIDEDSFEVGYPVSGKNSYYLYFYEVGTQAGTYVGEDGKLYDMPNIQAKPFMRPAFESNIKRIEAEIIRIIRKEMKL